VNEGILTLMKGCINTWKYNIQNVLKCVNVGCVCQGFSALNNGGKQILGIFTVETLLLINKQDWLKTSYKECTLLLRFYWSCKYKLGFAIGADKALLKLQHTFKFNFNTKL
jgi:hypothetical protein